MHHVVSHYSSFLVHCRKVCFGELFDSLLCATLDIFSILYLWKLGHVVIDFQCVVGSWFRQNFDQIESILYYFVLMFP